MQLMKNTEVDLQIPLYDEFYGNKNEKGTRIKREN